VLHVGDAGCRRCSDSDIKAKRSKEYEVRCTLAIIMQYLSLPCLNDIVYSFLGGCYYCQSLHDEIVLL
jgi:hypothetical protein